MDTEEKGDIVEVKVYMNGRGKEVREHVSVFTKNVPNFYRGTVMIGVSQVVNGRQMPPKPMPFEFALPEAKSLKHAFDSFDEVAKEALKKMNDEMKMRQAAESIVPASSFPAPKLTLR